MPKHLALILSLLLMQLTSYAQAKQGQARLDSLLAEAPKMKENRAAVELINDISDQYHYVNPDEGLKWGAKAVALAQKLGWKIGEAKAHDNIGNNYLQKSEHPAALEAFFKSLRILEAVGHKPGIGGQYNNIARVFFVQKDYPQALEWYFKFLTMMEDIGDRQGIMAVTANIAAVYQQQGKNREALEYTLKALRIAEELDDGRAVLLLTSNAGSAYAELKQCNLALPYFFKALRLAEATGQKQHIALNLGNAGELYYRIASDSTQLRPDSLVPASRSANLALAVQYMRRGIAGLREIQYSARAAGFSQSISDALALQGDYKAALAAYKESIALRDSIYNIENDAKIIRTEESYKFSKRADSLKVENEKRALALQQEARLAALRYEYEKKQTAAKNAEERRALQYEEGLKRQQIAYEFAQKSAVIDAENRRKAALAKAEEARRSELAKLAAVKKRAERIYFTTGIALLLVILGLLLYNFRRHERSRRRIKELQDYRISQLDEAVKRRTEQLGSMRQTIAADFHDQTGNMLAAITRQAATLEVKLLHQPEVLPAVRSIIANSNDLYASSKDFLWNLNHDSDDPTILLQYLSGYGQRFYNQFDISFSSSESGEAQPHKKLHPLAGLNLIYIFKEAMSNVVKHSGADEVTMEMRWGAEEVVYSLQDNGVWKEADPGVAHYGLTNMRRRCESSGFGHELMHDSSGTRVSVRMPLHTYAVQNQTA